MQGRTRAGSVALPPSLISPNRLEPTLYIGTEDKLHTFKCWYCALQDLSYTAPYQLWEIYSTCARQPGRVPAGRTNKVSAVASKRRQ
eukprot:5596916-Amphidinium_carterae.1